MQGPGLPRMRYPRPAGRGRGIGDPQREMAEPVAVSLPGEGQERVDERVPPGLVPQLGSHPGAPGIDRRRAATVCHLDVQRNAVVIMQAELTNLVEEERHRMCGADRRMPEQVGDANLMI